MSVILSIFRPLFLLPLFDLSSLMKACVTASSISLVQNHHDCVSSFLFCCVWSCTPDRLPLDFSSGDSLISHRVLRRQIWPWCRERHDQPLRRHSQRSFFSYLNRLRFRRNDLFLAAFLFIRQVPYSLWMTFKRPPNIFDRYIFSSKLRITGTAFQNLGAKPRHCGGQFLVPHTLAEYLQPSFIDLSCCAFSSKGWGWYGAWLRWALVLTLHQSRSIADRRTCRLFSQQALKSFLDVDFVTVQHCKPSTSTSRLLHHTGIHVRASMSQISRNSRKPVSLKYDDTCCTTLYD